MPEASPRFTLLTAARLLDGSGRPPLPGAALLIEDGRIASLGRQADIPLPDGAAVRRVAYGDATLLPGLVDAHTHLLSPGDGTPGDDVAMEEDDLLLLRAARNARIVLHSGVTTARENGAKHRVAFSLREGIGRGLTAGPRLVICGRPITMTGGHMWYFGSEADGPEGVRTEVRRLLREGADYIKIVASGGSTRTSDPRRASYTVAELRAMTDEARRHGRLTAAHCACGESVRNCLDAEVDMIVHCVFTEADGTYRSRPDLVERLAATGAWVNPTLYIVRAGIEHLTALREREGGLPAKQAAYLEWSKRELEERMQAVGGMIRAGVRMTAGSDSPWGWCAPGQFIHEVEILAEAGLTNAEAIVAGTAGAADSIGAGDVAGRLAPGREADILVVAGDPTEKLAALWQILDLYQGGRRVERATA